MAFTRKMLKALGLNEDQIESVMEEHVSVVDGLKAYKADAEKLADVQAQLDKAKKDLADAQAKGGDSDKLQKELDDLKKQIADGEVNAKKDAAFDAIAKEAGVGREAFRRSLRKEFDLSKEELDDSGALKNAAAIKEKITKEYSDFVGQQQQGGTDPKKPPAGGADGAPKSLLGALTERYNK